MSREAMKWFVGQFASDGTSQMLLQLLCWRADEFGEMPPLNIPYLARHSRQSERNVSRTLKEFEEVGIFSRTVTYAPDGGQRIAGKLNFEAQLQMLTVSERNAMRKAHGEGNEESVDNDGENVPSEDGESGPSNLAGPPPEGSRQIQHQVPPNTAETAPNLAGPSLYIEKPFKDSLKGAHADASAREREKLEDFQKRLEVDWPPFLKAFPFTEAMDLPAAKREFAKLNLGDREKATRYAADYAIAIKSAARTFPKEAWKWLIERQFEAIADFQQSRAEIAGKKRPQVFVIERTPWWDLWQTYRKNNGMRPMPTTTHDGKRGWWCDSQTPPKADTTGPPANDAGRDTDEADFGESGNGDGHE